MLRRNGPVVKSVESAHGRKTSIEKKQKFQMSMVGFNPRIFPTTLRHVTTRPRRPTFVGHQYQQIQ